ncbi:MAG: glutathione S-transferase family protein, partial [Cyanobacteriota bacterium]|nr:glutathione S-transferase family protein [Cyanobacteriota bacterium]
LKDGGVFIGDSTEIALYLERKYPEKPLIPTDLKQRGLCLMMEEWADESIGGKGRKAFIGAFNKNQNFRTSLLPNGTPDFFKSLIGSIPGEFLDVLGSGVGFGGDAVKQAVTALRQDLDALCSILQDSPYLVGNTPTLADLTVAGLSIILKFPDGPYLDIPEGLRGKGVPGLADNSTYEPFFAWRDRLYAEFRKPLVGVGGTSGAPTNIDIE